MQKDSQLFDDVAKLASSAAGTLMDIKREVEALVMDRVEKLMARADLVRREEFEVTRLMVEQARVKQEEILTKLAKLEKLLELNESNAKGTKSTAKK